MALYVSKAEAARRQIDAAVRMLFTAEDFLAVHTVVSAALGLVRDLADKRGIGFKSELRTALGQVVRSSRGLDLDSEAGKDLLDRIFNQTFPKALQEKNKAANFLKHADRNPREFLFESTLETEFHLAEACHYFSSLGFELTPEMIAFLFWWHRKTPKDDSEALHTSMGALHLLDRDAQLVVGTALLEFFRRKQA